MSMPWLALRSVSGTITFGGMDDKPEQISKIDHLLAHAIRIDPTNARAYTVRGLHYLSTRRTIEAEEAAQNAVRLNPNYAPAYVQLAQDQMMPAERRKRVRSQKLRLRDN
jgi:Tfp pilus assembly protein PilF